MSACSHCGGSGEVRCDSCGGSGVHHTSTEWGVECVHCGGSGEVTCPYCNGSGDDGEDDDDN